MTARRRIGLFSCLALLGACDPAVPGLDAPSDDAGSRDGGALVEDAGAFDAGAFDAGAFDAGAFDGGALDGGAVDGGSDAGAAISSGHLRGRVLEALSLDTVPIAGAVITATNGVSATTDAEGQFDLTGLPVGARVSLHIEPPHAGIVYSSTELLVDVPPSDDLRVDARLLRGCSAVLDLGAGMNTRPLSPCGSRRAAVGLELPVGGVVTATGAVVSRVRVEMAAIPSLAGGELIGEAFLAFPGDMTAREASGAEGWLESRGAAEVRLFDDVTGEPAQLAAGREATLVLPASPASIEDAAPRIWSYDVDARAWVEEGRAVIEVDAASGQLVTRMTVPHFSWWNSDQPATRTCLSGRILTTGGVMLEDTALTSIGVDYLGTSMARIAPDGRFEIFARASSTVELALSVRAGREAIRSVRLTTGAPGVCVDVGDLSIDTTRLVGCSRGRVEDALGAPVADADLTATQLGRAITARSASDGTFCLPLVGGIPAVVRVEASDATGAPLHGEALDVRAAGGSVCGGTCTDLGAIVVRAASCIAGTISDLSGPAAATLLFGGRTGASSARSLGDGTFCASVEAGQVYSAYGFFRDPSGSSSAEVGTVVVSAAAASCAAPATCARVDLVASDLTCVRGVALDALGAPLEGAIVRARPEGSARFARATTAADGSFCVAARVGENATIEVVRETRTVRDYTALTVSVSGGAATCGGSGCMDLGPLTLRRETFATCVRGRLLDGGLPMRTPIEAYTIDQVAILRPREDGRFCVDLDPGPPGTLHLTDPNTVGCARDRATTVSAPPLAGSSCLDEETCTDVGDVDFADFCAGS